MQAQTLVLQSHRLPLVHQWLEPCIDSVRRWCDRYGFEHRFMDDELFSLVPGDLLHKFSDQKVIATDLARLFWMQNSLQQGYQTVIWCDADFLVFKPEEFVLTDDSYALGREVWVQHDNKGQLRAYRKVHNAFMMFRQSNTFLDFYTETAERLLRMNTGTVPPQFIGPKLLTALHNIAHCPVMETAGMLSPLVMRDMLTSDGEALELFKHESPELIAAANLSSSVAQRDGLSEKQMQDLISGLLNE